MARFTVQYRWCLRLSLLGLFGLTAGCAVSPPSPYSLEGMHARWVAKSEQYVQRAEAMQATIPMLRADVDRCMHALPARVDSYIAPPLYSVRDIQEATQADDATEIKLDGMMNWIQPRVRARGPGGYQFAFVKCMTELDPAQELKWTLGWECTDCVSASYGAGYAAGYDDGYDAGEDDAD